MRCGPVVELSSLRGFSFCINVLFSSIMKKVLKNKNKPRVFVGMSGGVDSSVSAALLKEATPNNFEKLFGRPTPEGFSGYDVTGVFIKVWSPEWLPCDWKEERRDAMRCAAVLQIPFLTLDLEKEYKKGVVDYMVAEYKAGRIPNPDVMCNKTVKFGPFFDWAIKMGADYVATGHYARTAQVKSQKFIKSIKPQFQLLAGRDKNKDQSYFLWTLTQKQLSKTIFPVGHLEKNEVRKLAERFGLPTAGKKDSQGLCFLGKIDTKEFLKRYIKTKRGKILNEAGEIIGEHDGAAFYSIGERHGFSITEKSSKNNPYYVVGKNMTENTLTVSHNKSEEISKKKEIKIKDVNWISGKIPDLNKKYSARIRYREELKLCTLSEASSRTKKATAIFDIPEEFVASGQSLVIYDGEVCLGGGIII